MDEEPVSWPKPRKPRVTDEQRTRLQLKTRENDEKFEGTEFIAMLKPSSVKFNNSGDIEVGFVIPSRYREMIVPLGLAMRYPLTVTIMPWKNDGTED